MFYNADVRQIRMSSLKFKDVTYSSLMFDNIRPKNILVSIFDFLSGRGMKRYNGIYFNPRKQTDVELAGYLKNLKRNSLLKMIIEKAN